MKELSIEQKAKAYDEALEKSKRLYEQGTITECLGYIFPELKEGEDGRIRDWLIGYFHQYKEDGMEKYANGLKVESIIAWLEKQGKKSPSIIWHNINEEPEETKELFCEWESDDATWHDVAFYDEESKTFRLDKKPINVTKWVYVDELLEKQGEQKPQGKPALEAVKEEKVDNHNCAKTADKIEPKFHEGEWITNGDYTWKIVEVEPFDYILQSQDGNIVDDTISHVDEQFHSFTIEDAKDGDVLTFKNNIGGIIICKSPTDYDTRSYCRLVSDNFINKEESEWDSTLLVPATKEQRDQLEKAIAVAGYEWDAEKKELKKIEYKPAWSEEHELHELKNKEL